MSPSYSGPRCSSCFQSIAFCFGGASEQQPVEDSYWNQGNQGGHNAVAPPVLYINETLATHPPGYDKLRLLNNTKPLSCNSPRGPPTSFSKQAPSSNDAGPSQPTSTSTSTATDSPRSNPHRQDEDQPNDSPALASTSSFTPRTFAPTPPHLKAAQPMDVSPAPAPCTPRGVSRTDASGEAAYAEASSSSCASAVGQGCHAQGEVELTSGWDRDDDFCPTCLDYYTPENPKILTACAHHYHMPCIFEWMERKDTCPMCEAKMLILE